MNKKEQIAFAKLVKEKVKARGYMMSHFLSSIEISASHWHFIKKGERPLTDDNKHKIDEFLSK
jgi:hypothetical protein